VNDERSRGRFIKGRIGRGKTRLIRRTREEFCTWGVTATSRPLYLLVRIACTLQTRPIAIYVARSVVCLCLLSPQTDGPIEMRSRRQTHVDPKNIVSDASRGSLARMGIFEGARVRHPSEKKILRLRSPERNQYHAAGASRSSDVA